MPSSRNTSHGTPSRPDPGDAAQQPAQPAQHRDAADAARVGRPQEQGAAARQRREERILDAAASPLVRWGYRKTTIDDVAREAGVGKGTIYLHWKDKTSLFRAALWRANQQVGEEVMRRVAADPEGGLLHRLWAHGMMAALGNPLMAAVVRGQPDIFQGLLDSFDQDTRDQLMGSAEEYIAQLQGAGLIRADLSVSVISLLMSALKIGIIHSVELVGHDNMPSMEELSDALSDLIRRWLELEQPLGSSDAGKHILAEWRERVEGIAGLHE
jgi:AcrR family transcriptional regulator